MLVLMLMVLPFVTTFNDAITKLVESNGFYKGIQDTVVPFEAKFIGALLIPFGYSFTTHTEGFTLNDIYMKFTWNCIGWQSFLLIAITFVFGFTGQYSKRSILEALAIGVLGTFWINIIRMVFISLLAVHLQPLFRIVFHDYLAALVTIIWLFIFWWFSYSFVLVPGTKGKGSALN
jgi:exosortase/archaeosortase family protein